MTTPEKPHPKKDPSVSAGAAKTRQAHIRRMEYADFLQRTDRDCRAGPGAYTPAAPSQRYPGPSYSFGSRYWDLYYSDYRAGPGSYTPAAPSGRYPGPSYSFGSRSRNLYYSVSPGPAYFPPSPSSLRPGPKFSITSRHMPSRFAITVEEE